MLMEYVNKQNAVLFNLIQTMIKSIQKNENPYII